MASGHSSNHPFVAKYTELVRVESEQRGQHVIGVLAHQREGTVWSFGIVRQLDGVACHQDWLVDAIGPGHLNQHVALGDVRVTYDILRAEAGSAGDPGAG